MAQSFYARNSNACTVCPFDVANARVQTEKEADALMTSIKHCIRQDRRALIEASGKVPSASIYSISLIAFGEAACIFSTHLLLLLLTASHLELCYRPMLLRALA